MTAPRPHLPPVPAVAFVLVWCSGYIAGPAAVHAAAPFSVLGWRFLLAALIAVPLALLLRRRPGMDRPTLVRVATVGL
ncbi:MAG TPA: EamA family transporter, partial [Nocardioides sp.]